MEKSFYTALLAGAVMPFAAFAQDAQPAAPTDTPPAATDSADSGHVTVSSPMYLVETHGCYGTMRMGMHAPAYCTHSAHYVPAYIITLYGCVAVLRMGVRVYIYS